MRRNVFRVVGCVMLLVFATSARAQADPDEDKGNSEAAVAHRDALRARLVKARKSDKFQAAVKKLATMTGSQPANLDTMADGEDTGGVQFEVTHAKADALLDDATRKAFFAQGAYLFRSMDNLGLEVGGQVTKDFIALLPTTDSFEVVEAMETGGPNSDVYNPDLLKWLRELHKTQPFQLTGVSADSLSAKFNGPVKDPKALAAKVLKLCPDLDHGDGAEAALAKISAELQQGKLYLWWD